MPACPSCGAENSGGSACSRCGAKAPALDVPDLDLSSVTGPVSAPNPPVRRTSGAMPAVMPDDDPLAADAGEASFELAVLPGDIGLPPGVSTPPSSLPNPSLAPAPVPNASTAGPASQPDVRVSPPPSAPEPPRISALEARVFADYGEPPPGALQSPMYAFRVKTRQSDLRRGLWRAKNAFEQAQKDQAKALADPSRLDEVKARLAADVEAREHDVDLHEAALDAFDTKAVQRGMTVAFSALAILFVAIFVPVFFRMCVGVEAPPLTPSAQ